MVQKFFRKKSKRMTYRLRYKIDKKVREYNRKVRKEAKKTGPKRKRKDPGVPNKFPFKQKILEEAQERKKQAEDLKKLRKEQRQALQDKHRNLESLQEDATLKAELFEKKVALESEAAFNAVINPPLADRSLKAYYKEFKKVVEASDVVLEVLDARDPMGSRCTQVENAVLNSGANKRLVLVLNKIDLIPKDNLMKWLKYLRNEFPTVAFKASTQKQRNNLALNKLPVHLCHELHMSSNCFGAGMLMNLLGNYCRNKDIKVAITVGIVGFPNVGKSSIINSLKRSKVCNIGAVPGVTKAMQEIYLHKYVKLLDSPGVVMSKNSSDAAVALRNAVKAEELDDPYTPVEAIIRRCPKEQLMKHFNIGNFDDVSSFLCLLATRKGYLKKGGVPHPLKAARAVINDWNRGKIHYYTHPPEEHTLPVHVSAEIVSAMSAEFDIDALVEEEQSTLKDFHSTDLNDPISVRASKLTDLDDTDMVETIQSNSDEEMDIDSKSQISDVLSDHVSVTFKKRKKLNDKEQKSVSFNEENLQLNRMIKAEYKKQKKMARKAAKDAETLASTITAVSLEDNLDLSTATPQSSEGDNYDFNIL